MLLNKDVIIKPYHTEKSYGLRKMQDPSCLTFVVNKKSNKHEIYTAFKAIYNVEPEKINILNRKPKAARLGAGKQGYTKLYKLAFIVLPKGVQIAITKDEMEEAVKANSENATATPATTKKVEVKAEEKPKIPKAAVKRPVVKKDDTFKTPAKKTIVKSETSKTPVKKTKQ